MNILFFEDIINPEKGGVQRVTSILAQKLRKEKHLVFVCYFAKDDYNNWQEYFDDIFFFNNNLNELSYFISKYAIDIVINQAILCNNQPLFDLKKNHKYKIISAFHTCPDFPILTCRDKSLSHPYQFVRKCIKQFYLKFKRDDIILLCKNNEVLWVPGVCLSEKLRVKTLPTHVIKIENR